MSRMVFDEIHVVSDLHLGGMPGFQIFCQGDTLAAMIRGLAAAPASRRVGLVLNGDIVDFLAESPAAYLDPAGAIEKLKRIFNEDPAFTDVWKALKEFVGKRNRHLVLLLGNHDVELALPHVTEWVVGELSAGKEAARGRISNHVDGAGFACSVGDKSVLCVHGNEVDTWNLVDYRQLLEVARAVNRSQTPKPWDANAGTRLVIDVMNSVKADFPLVDLLKPEVEAALPIVLALDSSRLREITKLLKVASFLSRDSLRRQIGFLSAEKEMEQEPATLPSDEEVLGSFLSSHFSTYGTSTKPREGSLLDDALDGLDTADTTDLPGGEEEFLGPFDYVKALFGSAEKRADRLREALKDKLKGDRTFDVTYEDEPYKALKEEVGDGVDYLVAGHTHLERAIEREHRGRSCYYYNSGTWIRLIQLTEEILDDADQFARVYHAFKGRDVAALDEVKDLGPERNEPLVLLRPTVVSIVKRTDGVYGTLNRAQPDGSLVPQPDTQFPRPGP